MGNESGTWIMHGLDWNGSPTLLTLEGMDRILILFGRMVRQVVVRKR